MIPLHANLAGASDLHPKLILPGMRLEWSQLVLLCHLGAYDARVQARQAAGHSRKLEARTESTVGSLDSLFRQVGEPGSTDDFKHLSNGPPPIPWFGLVPRRINGSVAGITFGLLASKGRITCTEPYLYENDGPAR